MARESWDNPATRATQYRVEHREAGRAVLVNKERPQYTHDIGPDGIYLHLSVAPRTVARSLSTDRGIGNSRWMIFDVLECEIGHRGEAGYRSYLADDSIFVVDGEQLRHLPLPEVRIVSLDEFRESRARIADLQETTVILRGESTEEDTPDDEWAGGRAFAQASLSHIEADGRDWPEALELTVGIPEPHFTEIAEQCVRGAGGQIYLHGIAFGRSTAASYEVARDLVLFAGESVRIRAVPEWICREFQG